jgi:hypothetical protein
MLLLDKLLWGTTIGYTDSGGSRSTHHQSEGVRVCKGKQTLASVAAQGQGCLRARERPRTHEACSELLQLLCPGGAGDEPICRKVCARLECGSSLPVIGSSGAEARHMQCAAVKGGGKGGAVGRGPHRTAPLWPLHMRSVPQACKRKGTHSV